SIIASVSGSFIYAVSVSVISKILIFLLVCMAMIKLRKNPINNKSFFKLRYGKLSATLGVIASIGLLFSSKLNDLLDVIVTVCIGLLLYALYKTYRTIKISGWK